MDKSKSYEAPAWSALPTAEFQLEVLKDGSIVDTINLKDKEFFTLGRQHGLVDIAMDHPSISRLHAVLNFREDGALMLRDMGSAQGTQLNKTPCEKDVYYRVYVGDMIRFGASTRKYIVAGPEEHRKEEYNSANMENYREKLAIRSAEIKVKLDKEAQKEEFSWGMRDDAEAEEGADQQPEEDLPEYLKKLKKDEHFDRKYGEKFTAEIKESEAKNSKDAEILDKIRKKERKIQNMQEENRRIYLKENSQESGLTEGQMAAVNRNDKSITLLQEEIEQLIGQIRAKSADRAGPDGASAGSKRSIHEAEDDILDLTTQTADASTNWRLRKKMQKTANSATGTSGNTSGDTDNHALSYAEIKQQLATQTELSVKLGQQVDDIRAMISTQESELLASRQARDTSGAPQEDIDSLLAKDRVAEGRATLKRLQNDQTAVALKVARLEKLLKVATPALSSLVSKSAHISHSSTENHSAAGTSVPASAPTGSSSTVPAVTAAGSAHPTGAKVQGPARPDTSTVTMESTTTAAGGDDKLKNLMRFIEEEKAAEEAERRKKEEEAVSAKAKADVKKAPPVPRNADCAADVTGADKSAAAVKTQPAASVTNAAGAVKGAVNKAPSAPRVQGPQGPPRYAGNVLEGGESDWVPPPKQSGDGKTALNAKYGY